MGKKKALGAYAPDYPHSVAANAYGFYCVPDAYKKREAARELINGLVYEPGTLGLLRRLARQGGDVITGGAFVGDFSPALSEAMGKGARLHTFEPNPMSKQAVRYTLALNRLTNVAFHEVGIGAVPGQLKLQVAKEDGTPMAGTSKIVGADAMGETVDVEISTLDDLVDVSRRVSVIHLDIEGHEVAALSGAERIIQEEAPDLVLEAPKRWMQRAIEKHLREYHSDLDYTLCGSIDRNAIYRALARA